jgi:hypothetical protein
VQFLAPQFVKKFSQLLIHLEKTLIIRRPQKECHVGYEGGKVIFFTI